MARSKPSASWNASSSAAITSPGSREPAIAASARARPPRCFACAWASARSRSSAASTPRSAPRSVSRIRVRIDEDFVRIIRDRACGDQIHHTGTDQFRKMPFERLGTVFPGTQNCASDLVNRAFAKHAANRIARYQNLAGWPEAGTVAAREKPERDQSTERISEARSDASLFLK